MALGEDAVLFAIDYPYESGEAAVCSLKTAPLSGSARDKVAWRNAERLLRVGQDVASLLLKFLSDDVDWPHNVARLSGRALRSFSADMDRII